MKTSNKIQWLVRLTAGSALLALAAGCEPQHTDMVHGEDFVPADDVRIIHEYNDIQAANAARADSTLRKYHFDNGALNSLGEARLDSILHNGDSVNPLTVYLDLHAGDVETTHCEKSTIAYLRDRGLNAEQIKIAYGPNPNVNSLVAPLLASQGAPPAAVPGQAGGR